MDHNAFGSLAQITVLLVPVGPLTQDVFETWASEIRTLDEIRLSDIPSDARDDRARFMPSPLAAGSLFVRFTRHPPPSSRLPLSLFRPSAFPLGVIGIASCGESGTLACIPAQFEAAQAEAFPSQWALPLARTCFVFEESEGNAAFDTGISPPGCVVIPSMMGNKKLYIGTLLAELCSNILGEFSSLIKMLETPSGNEALNDGPFANLQSFLDCRSLVSGDKSHGAQPPALGVQHSQPEMQTDATVRLSESSKIALKRSSTTGPGGIHSANRKSSLNVAPSKKRQSTVAPTASHGRLYKVLGDLFLLAGRTMDATIWYNEAIVLLKQTQDLSWNASALEGMAVAGVIDAWWAEQNSTTGADQSWSELSERLLQASACYSRAAIPFGDEESFSNFAYLYISAAFRHTSFLLAIWANSGWNSKALTVLLRGKPETINVSLPLGGLGNLKVERPSNIAGATRADISMSLSQAHGPWLLQLGPRERIDALRFMADTYSSLGYYRKQAYTLRELLACVLDFIVQGRDEKLSVTAPSTAGESSKHDSFLTDSPPGDADNRAKVGYRPKDDIEGNDSILRLILHVCEIHGLNLNAVSFCPVSEESRPSTSSTSPFDARGRLHQETTNMHGWPGLWVGLAREALAIAEALPDYSAIATFALSSLKQLFMILEPEDQYHFYTSSARAMATVQRRGNDRKLKYWPGPLVASIRVAPLSPSRAPVERLYADLRAKARVNGADASVRLDPFLYNPRKSINGKQQFLIVENETVQFTVTLHNPYSIALELMAVALSTTGVAFTSIASPAIIPANSIHSVTLSGTATESGILVIRGCFLHLPGSEPHEALLPVYTDEEEEKQLQSAISLANDSDRLKPVTPSTRLHAKERRDNDVELDNDQSSLRFLQVNVVQEQPFLRIRRTSLTNGAVMLYDGERAELRLTVENISTLPIDYLDLSFEDSLKSRMLQLLAEGDLSAFETYEMEYSLVEKSVFSWNSKRERGEIRPGEESVISVKCFGQAGCTDGNVLISYSLVTRPDAGQPSVFYTRHLVFPVLVTVYQMLDCHDMNVVNIRSAALGSEEFGSGNEWTTLLKDVDELDWCILSLDVQNTYGLPFEVTLTSESKVTISRIISPGSTHRFILPVERFSLASSSTSAPIPSLTGRQFVVTSLTSSDEKLQRELFWYREELLKRVRANWKEATGTRKGELSLRHLRFTLPMLRALRTDTIRTQMIFSKNGLAKEQTIKGPDRAEPSPSVAGLVIPFKSISLTVAVRNLSASPLVLVLTLNAEPSDLVIFGGASTSVPLGRLLYLETVEKRFTVVFLAQGQFSLFAKAESKEGTMPEITGGDCEMKVSVQNGVA